MDNQSTETSKNRAEAFSYAIEGAILRSNWAEVAGLIRRAGADAAQALRPAHVWMTSPLKAAITAGQQSIVELMAKAGADLNEVGRRSGSPLALAVERGDLGMVRLLIEQGADITVMGEGSGQTLLMRAIHKRYADIALLLIEAGVPCHHLIVSNNGLSALDYALDDDLPDLFLALVAKDALASVDVAPLALAVRAGSIRTMHACLADDALSAPAKEGQFDLLLADCPTDAARHVLLSWRTAREVVGAIGEPDEAGASRRRTSVAL